MPQNSGNQRLNAAAGITACLAAATAAAEHCPDYEAGRNNLYWGDLHVHSAYSLDAYGYGTLETPKDAYEFARGKVAELADGSKVQLDRPLDFTAVTDHAEWFDLLYICTDPEWDKNPYCTILREKSAPKHGRAVFNEYVIPTITQKDPWVTPICTDDPERCANASRKQWDRIQAQTNSANEPCEFTALNGFEWSATPDFSHTHRNVIFGSDQVTDDAIDYIRTPELHELWRQLDKQCRPEDGCDVITIPHNTNMGDGKSFDVETETDRQLQTRSRYERLVEIFQEKGGSECLSPLGSDEDDCNFELYLTGQSKPQDKDSFSEEEWERMRRTYVRGLLARGLESFEHSSEHSDEHAVNPLQLGIIGSTDDHAGLSGYTDESDWQGTVYGVGNFERAMQRVNWNPGGVVGVWAEENTRASIFAALKRREVYGTSGPRIELRFSARTDGVPISCGRPDKEGDIIAMGGDFSEIVVASPQFRVNAEFDEVPLESVEIIKGEWRGGESHETRVLVWSRSGDGKSLCQTWTDEEFEATAPAYWYARVIQAPTPRWSWVLCQKEGRCDEYPDMQKTVTDRAWSSPIWYLPVSDSQTEHHDHADPAHSE